MLIYPGMLVLCGLGRFGGGLGWFGDDLGWFGVGLGCFGVVWRVSMDPKIIIYYDDIISLEGNIFTASIGSVVLLYPSVFIYCVNLHQFLVLCSSQAMMFAEL